MHEEVEAGNFSQLPGHLPTLSSSRQRHRKRSSPAVASDLAAEFSNPTRASRISEDAQAPPFKKVKRGTSKRSSEKRKACTAKYIAKCESRRLSRTETITVPGRVDHLRPIKQSGEIVRATMAATCPSVDSLPNVAEDLTKSTILHFLQSHEQSEVDTDENRVHAQPTLAHLYPDLVTEAQETQLVAAMDRFFASEPELKIKRDGDNRSRTLAFHLGVWLMTRKNKRAAPTAESRQKNQTCNDAIDALLILIKRFILDPLEKILAHDYPAMYARAQRAHTVVRRHCARAFRQRPALDIGPIAFTVAVKSGSSERLHSNFTDDFDHFSYIVPLGDGWSGGDWCSPQLGYRVPVPRRSAFAARTHLLAHCSGPVVGQRFVLTLFTDKTLLRRGDSIRRR